MKINYLPRFIKRKKFFFIKYFYEIQKFYKNIHAIFLLNFIFISKKLILSIKIESLYREIL